MQRRHVWGYTGLALVVALIVGTVTGVSYVAAQSSSQNYQMVETEFGTGGLTESCSAGYCAQTTMGQAGAQSSATSADFTEIQYSEPMLEMIVTAGEANLGTLTTERTATQTMNVRVRNFLTDGYILQILGDPPSYNGHKLATSSTPQPATPGKEQFGINVVENTTPKIGKDPAQNPADAEIFGEAMPNYATPNMFMYRSGDVFARSVLENGGTDYTISMIVNISSGTPAGHYSGDFSAVLIPAF